MIRLVGALLISAGSAWFGFAAAGRLEAKARALSEAADGLGQMARELELDQPTLKQVMDRLIPGSRGTAQALFHGCRSALEHLEKEPFSKAWERLVQMETALGEAGQRCLLPLGQVLGRCGWEEECRALKCAAQHLRKEEEKIREERLRMGRVYQVLGVTGGAFLVILLL